MNKKLKKKTKQSTRSRLANTAVAKAMEHKVFLQKLFVARPKEVTNCTIIVLPCRFLSSQLSWKVPSQA